MNKPDFANCCQNQFHNCHFASTPCWLVRIRYLYILYITSVFASHLNALSPLNTHVVVVFVVPIRV